MALAAVSLDDKYTLEAGRVYLTGIQALVRLPMMQRQRDLKAGLNTACFISGYRGSPLGGFDQQLWRARPFLEKNHIRFNPGVNEDLAATSIWGSQQTGLAPGAKYDGVYGMWYGKGPGVDRCGDVFKHANMAGTALHGGVLALLGDDHISASSTLPHQSEYAMMSAMMPVLNPAGVQEILDFGLYGWALSRYSGCWIGFKTIAETVETSGSVDIDAHRIDIVTPDFEMPPGGVNVRWPELDFLEQERRHHLYKLYAALAFVRANRLDKVMIDSPKPRLGIVTTGKSYLDVRQALDDLGIDEALAAEIGIRVYKVAMTWPLEREGVCEFAEGLEEIIVVEEKRALIENQLKEQLYNWRAEVRPRVIGKFDETGEWILPSNGELTPARIARLIAARIARFHKSPKIDDRLAFLAAKEKSLDKFETAMRRIPWFCPGCPHNTSTKVPEGSRAMAGIGCHYMALWMDRDTQLFSHMGGEGAAWIGQAPFTEQEHVFVNLGDGTFFHSGSLAIRAAVASGVNITYKILYNDAVAMTGGQPVEGQPTVPQISHMVHAEGVRRIVVVSDEPDKYPIGTSFAPGVSFHHRDDLDEVQRELREWTGVSVLIYDQTCAAEKRRRRKRGTFPDPDRRVIINELVCEGCGDCGEQSNCLAVVPVETEFGRKRAIDQSACNKDFSCLKGFCPSFAIVEGGKLRKPKPAADGVDESGFAELPEPTLPSIDTPYGILITGVGGTGVITIGALLGMAAHIEGKGISVLDMTGLSQKGGAVISHVRISDNPGDLHATRIAAGDARLVLGCDLVVAAGSEAVVKMRPGFTNAVINSHETMTGAFTHDADLAFPEKAMRAAIEEATGAGNTRFIEATRQATALLGDSIATNLFMLGVAWQMGHVPISHAAIEAAIELNGVAVASNMRAFLWGRRAAHDPDAVARVAIPPEALRPHDIATDLEGMIAKRAVHLTGYQDAAYAHRYESFVRRVASVEAEKAPGRSGLAEAAARYYFKLLAYKDEYEVARLHSDPAFHRQLSERFEGEFRVKFSLAPPLLAERDKITGHLRKKEYGAWMMSAFRFLARFKGLRGSWLDPFGHSDERKAERQLIADYEATLAELLSGLNAENHGLAVDIASVPEHIRGYGHIKVRHIDDAKANEAALLDAFRSPAPAASAAE